MIGDPLDHIAIHVLDRAAAAVLVGELLGQEVLQELEVPHQDGTARLTTMVQPGERFRLVLCDAEGEGHPISRWLAARGPGVHHIAHRVATLEHALEGVENAGGIRVGPVVDANGLRQVFTDVTRDGLLHELTERASTTEGFVQRNTAALIVAGADRNAMQSPAPHKWHEDRR